MTFDFDRIIDRRNTNSLKWDLMEARYGVSKDTGIPMWVADMDFLPPDAVNEMLQANAAHGINGYYGDESSYQNAIVSWLDRRHGYTVDPAWITTVPGVVPGYSLAIQAFSEPGDGVLVFSPVYHAFGRAIEANGRKVVESELVQRDGQYHMDFEGLADLVDERTKILLLCSPHNPGGRVWTEEELRELCDFCLKRNILIISDEVHHDLVFDGHRHVVTATLSEEIAANTITFAAASKTFNLAGFMTAAAIISNPEIRRKYVRQVHACGLGPNRLGILATVAAYDHGELWLEALLPYLKHNEERFAEGLEAAIPGAKVMRMPSTYLSWVDMSGVDLEFKEIVNRIEQEAQIATNLGAAFGKGGEQFMRFNLACPTSVVKDALGRIEHVFEDLRTQATIG
ncbi:pyridoxal phosphate-dependent aminotransferase [Pseudovibrio exalbescens]|uniref:MalY/PatB family protein n=1 Tax=Pseudovibrio exalbescens TaxID=197461 RepID=UPI002366E102|nr:MalY/PatB family protein [Pseudovibrio exalbescens]MDD7911177.1 pyridoxal phosphate-dependent aminotransferase [Pseudovibrio exalbescens]